MGIYKIVSTYILPALVQFNHSINEHDIRGHLSLCFCPFGGMILTSNLVDPAD